MAHEYAFINGTSELTRDPVASGVTLHEGEFVFRKEDGTVRRFDPANDNLPDGIITHNEVGDGIVEHDEDYVAYSDLWTYDGDEGDRVYYLPLEPGDRLNPQTVKDTGLTEPSISDGDTVGIVTIGSSGETRIVESGYTDGGTTYSESGGGDFVALGRVYQEPQAFRLEDQYDERVPVRLTPRVFQP